MPKSTIKNANFEKRKELCQKLYHVCLTPNDNFKFEPGFIEIFSLLEIINKIESDIPFCCSNTRDNESFAAFSQFLTENNCNLENKLSIEKFENSGYGLKTKSPFQKGDILFQVPRSIILSLNEANGTDLEALLKSERLLIGMPNVALALLVLYLKTTTTKNGQKWSRYLAIIPSEFSTPLYFSLDEIKMLQNSQCFYDVLFHIRNIARQYAYLFNLLSSKDGLDEFKSFFSYKNYRWCVSAVSTRQNQIVDENKKPILAMIPFLDMCNHDFGEFCTDYDDENHCALCFANYDFKVGDEVKIFYGQRTNSEMLIHNGFVPESNRFDKFKLKLGLSVHDALFQQRSLVLKEFGLNNSEVFELSQEKIPLGVFFFVKIFTIKSSQELTKIGEFETKNLEAFVQSKNLNEDEEVVKFLQMRLKIILKSLEKQQNQFSNGIEGNMSPNVLFIKRLVVSEIYILNNLIQIFSLNQ